MNNIYIPEWHIKQFLYYLRGHLVEGDMTHKQMILAIDNYIKDVNEEEAVELNEKLVNKEVLTAYENPTKSKEIG